MTLDNLGVGSARHFFLMEKTDIYVEGMNLELI